MIKLLLKVPYIDQKVLDTISAKLTASFGGNFGEIVIGGAAINKEVETFLHSIHFRYTVGYGMTECGPLVSYAQWDEFKPGSVGVSSTVWKSASIQRTRKTRWEKYW